MKNSIPSARLDEADVDSDDSEDLPFPDDIDEDSLDEALSSEEKSDNGDGKIEESGSDENDLNFEDEAADLLGSDDEAPDGLLHFSSEEGGETWGGIGATVLGKRKGGKEEAVKANKKKRRLKDLPLFASVEDYARLIDGQPEDNL
jgi:ribosome biogenesis protein MAK21